LEDADATWSAARASSDGGALLAICTDAWRRLLPSGVDPADHRDDDDDGDGPACNEISNIQFVTAPAGELRLCKVAGTGIDVGTLFVFTIGQTMVVAPAAPGAEDWRGGRDSNPRPPT
jgi:hypothetical protein